MLNMLMSLWSVNIVYASDWAFTAKEDKKEPGLKKKMQVSSKNGIKSSLMPSFHLQVLSIKYLLSTLNRLTLGYHERRYSGLKSW